MARIGELAAVIAHEVRNPLTAVRGAIQVIGGRLPADSKDAPIIKAIVARLDALNTLIQDLLTFARTPQPRFGPVEIVSLLELTSNLLSTDPTFAPVRVDIVGKVPPISADADLLTIVFQNLLLNAAQAMPDGGEIRVSVTADDGHQRVSIADDGPGIAPDARGQMFRPFFTTKARGTGLGLATAKRLVDAHRGRIAVECPPEGGTRVTVWLPDG